MAVDDELVGADREGEAGVEVFGGDVMDFGVGEEGAGCGVGACLGAEAGDPVGRWAVGFGVAGAGAVPDVAAGLLGVEAYR